MMYMIHSVDSMQEIQQVSSIRQQPACGAISLKLQMVGVMELLMLCGKYQQVLQKWKHNNLLNVDSDDEGQGDCI